MKRGKWKRGTSAQSKRTKLKRWGPPGYVAHVKSYPCCVGERCEGPIDCAHVVPRSRGGGWEGNLVPLCRKHHREFDEQCHNDLAEFRRRHGIALDGAAGLITFEARQKGIVHD